MIDGLDVAGSCMVVAPVITAEGTKVPVGLWLATPRTRRWSPPCWPTWSPGALTPRPGCSV